MKANELLGAILRKTLVQAAAALAIAWLGSGPLEAADPDPQPDDARQVWLISTRQAGCSTTPDAPPLSCRRLAADQTWLDADRKAFLESDDPDVPTCIFVHGNRQTRQAAIQTGMSTLRRLTAGREDRPLRFVIWSWPAEQVYRRNREDLRLKACRSDRESLHLARCLDRIRPDVPVSLVGYSYGARVITGALHILGGGKVAGRELAEPGGDARPTLKAVLVAAALDNYSLLPGRRNGLALEQLDAVLVTRNGCDPVLRWYPRLYGRGGPNALGYTGPACPSRLGDQREKLDLLDVTCSVGKDHSWRTYLCSGALRAKVAGYVFREQSRQTTPAEGPGLTATAAIPIGHIDARP